MFIFKRQFVLAIVVPVLFSACGSLNTRGTPAPVEEPGQVSKPDVITSVTSVPTIGSTIKQKSPALKKLRLTALSQQRSGNYARSAATLERALRISPRDAPLWHQLADVRLQQKKWRLAVNMAAKSNALAAQQPSLQRKNWLIMAKAYRGLGQIRKANDAMHRAR